MRCTIRCATATHCGRGTAPSPRCSHRGTRAPRSMRVLRALRRRRAHHRAHRAESARPRDLSGLRDDARAACPALQRGARALPEPAPRRARRRPRTAPTSIVDLLARCHSRRSPPRCCAKAASSPTATIAELDELRAIQNNCGAFLLDLEARERAAQRHRQSQGRVQPRARLLHRGHARADRQRAGRLPAAPDAEERRALHHAGAESVRGQGALRAGTRARAREAALRGSCSTTLAPHSPALQRAAARARRRSTRSPRSPSAQPRWTGTRPNSSTSR